MLDMDREIERRVKLLAKAKNDTDVQSVEFELCRKDPLYFFKNYTYTDKNTNLYPDSYPAILPFIPYEFQEEAITEIWSSIYNGTQPLHEREDLTNVFIEKSRQM